MIRPNDTIFESENKNSSFQVYLIASAWDAIVVSRATPMVRNALFTVDTLRIALTIDAMTSMAGFLEELLIEVAAIGELTAVAGDALVGLVGRASFPWSVIEERKAFIAVGS